MPRVGRSLEEQAAVSAGIERGGNAQFFELGSRMRLEPFLIVHDQDSPAPVILPVFHGVEVEDMGSQLQRASQCGETPQPCQA